MEAPARSRRARRVLVVLAMAALGAWYSRSKKSSAPAADIDLRDGRPKLLERERELLTNQATPPPSEGPQSGSAPMEDVMTNQKDINGVTTNGVGSRVAELLGTPRVVAVVGMSPKTDRASNYVARYLREQGFTTIPVNPTVTEVDGLKSYADLAALPKEPKVDVVALFVAPQRTMSAVEQAAAKGFKIVWFQPGAEHPPSEQRARELGLEVFTGFCMKGEHERMLGGTGC